MAVCRYVISIPFSCGRWSVGFLSAWFFHDTSMSISNYGQTLLVSLTNATTSCRSRVSRRMSGCIYSVLKIVQESTLINVWNWICLEIAADMTDLALYLELFSSFRTCDKNKSQMLCSFTVLTNRTSSSYSAYKPLVRLHFACTQFIMQIFALQFQSQLNCKCISLFHGWLLSLLMNAFIILNGQSIVLSGSS